MMHKGRFLNVMLTVISFISKRQTANQFACSPLQCAIKIVCSIQYDKQDRQGLVAFNERIPHMAQQHRTTPNKLIRTPNKKQDRVKGKAQTEC
jgi:hypothetical protein